MIARDISSQGPSFATSTQDVSLRDIDPEKLSSKLQKLFRNNDFEVYVKHDTYCIQAPRLLSEAEIAECTVLDESRRAGHQPHHPAKGKHSVKGKWPMMFRGIWGRDGWF
ncbi:hypothetical protein NKR19_g8469 [Coniochaeta hoffmannii]|uniref:Uncharacterized protein n=1 Tax=Coniochaeta hoffmannii TaxID=91930 RepID=A0AA38RG74_9PEZI|nr:hypothetical protein NKR19_g8469 [Coniochaeta hoffmannii]